MKPNNTNVPASQVMVLPAERPYGGLYHVTLLISLTVLTISAWLNI